MNQESGVLCAARQKLAPVWEGRGRGAGLLDIVGESFPDPNS
jgi:hypothetical protein